MNEPLKTFYVLDFDRTLADTDALFRVFESVLDEHGIDLVQLKEVRRREEAPGNSFETVSYLRKQFAENGTRSWATIKRQFIAEARTHDVLESGARELLAKLDSQSIPYGILTFGDEAWQLAKLEAADCLSIPHIVTQIKEKSTILKSWKQENSPFLIPSALLSNGQARYAKTIVFLDDKAVSFQNIPEGVRGIHVVSPSGMVLPSQKGVLPDRVVSVKGLSEAIKLLFAQ